VKVEAAIHPQGRVAVFVSRPESTTEERLT